MKNDKTFEEQLDQIFNEATFDIDSDVDYIWNLYGKKLISYYKKNSQDIYNVFMRNSDVEFVSLDSSSLPSDLSKKAYSVNPVMIRIGVFRSGSAYNIKGKEIRLSLNRNAVLELGPSGLKNKEALVKFPTIKSEFTEKSIRGTIAHELTHWISDSIRNSHLKKTIADIDKAINDLNKKFNKASNHEHKKEAEKKLFDFQIASLHEQDAYVHAIKEIKRSYTQEKWDKLRTEDLVNIKPSFFSVFNRFTAYPEEVYFAFYKRFFGRLAKEGLLGKNMRPIPYEKLKTMDISKKL
jgi:predicted SprT family Zn-dependent metalloprotease